MDIKWEMEIEMRRLLLLMFLWLAVIQAGKAESSED